MWATSPVSNKPSSSRTVRTRPCQIGAGDGRAADLQPAESLAVPREARGPRRRSPSSRRRRADGPASPGYRAGRRSGRPAMFRLQRAERADRRHLGHAPGVHDLDVVAVLELLDHRARAGGSRRSPPAQIGKLLAGLLQMLQQHQPDRRHGGGEGHPLACRAAHRSTRRRACGPGMTSLAPTIGAPERKPQALAWNIGTTGISRSRADSPIMSGNARSWRAARWSDGCRATPFGGRSCRRCSTCRRQCSHRTSRQAKSSSSSPAILRKATTSGGRLRHVRRVGQHDHLLHRFSSPRQSSRAIGMNVRSTKSSLVFGIVDDPGDLLGKEARVQRVIDAADAHAARTRLRCGRQCSRRASRCGRPGLKPSASSRLATLKRAASGCSRVGGATIGPSTERETISRSPCCLPRGR